MGEFWKHFETLFENTLKHIIWKPLKPMSSAILNTIETHNLKTIETYGRFLKKFWNTFWKHTIWKPLKPMGDFWKHFETHYLKTLLNTQFENHWNLWEIFENTLKHIIWKQFEMHNLKTIETYEEFWKHFETHHLKTLWNLWEIFENTLKHILKTYNLKTIETYGEFWKHFETHYLKTIETYEDFWKHFETHNLKTIETYGRFLKTLWNTLFENTLKHTIWKSLKHLGDFWKHFENHIDTPLSYHHSGVTIETLGFQLALKWNTYVQPCMERKSAFFTLLNV